MQRALLLSRRIRHDPASYGFAAGQAYCKTCEKEVLEVLLDVLKTAPKDLRCDGNQRDYRCCEDLSFHAIQVS
jgi:phospholipase/lecithinase/hemolysin